MSIDSIDSTTSKASSPTSTHTKSPDSIIVPVSRLFAPQIDRLSPRDPDVDPLEAYWIERAKFIKHLERRQKKFAKKSKADLDKAKGIKKPKKVKPAASIAPSNPEQPILNLSSKKSNEGTSDKMIANTAVNVMKRASAIVSQGNP
jgi:hypothetical protein